MAHFALINKDNIVIQVIVVGNNKLLENGIEVEQKGIDWLINDFNIKGQFSECEIIKQTSYNGSIRNKFAGIGDEWDEENNLFRGVKLFPSWLLNKDKTAYEAPIQSPGEGYYWSEEKLNWVKN